QMLQHVFGYPTTDAGLAMAPRGVGAILGAWLAARLAHRVDPRITIGVAFFISFITFYWMATFSPAVTETPFLINGFLQGISMGLAWPPMAAVAFNGIETAMMAEASGMYYFMRTFFSSLFVAIPTLLYTQNVQINHAQMAEHAA